MFSLKAVVALMGLVSIAAAAPAADNVKRLDDIKSCYCGRDTGSARVSDPASTTAACPDYGSYAGPYPTICKIMIDINEPLFINKCKSLGQPIGWCEK
ncbi:hypothetical protein Cob_v004735 [Colletotrichum orbiculare MAFF 240422]|uniref:Uncharacterized protein n=1 Tax=Colletotrichum orbiculare (strain 104-T / ATCC 96160 / CBS 514.97 / LARS 414 / MAFF 240422) TaxID=1213857 RepID=N4VEY8_COLOR|nr:hypothetical protein Cob_v004735 [Colletotrichum orbiculare MAFF 240422]